MARPKSTLEGVADQIPSVVTLLRDRCRGRNLDGSTYRWSLASLRPPATLRDASGVGGRSLIRGLSPFQIFLDRHARRPVLKPRAFQDAGQQVGQAPGQ